MFLLVLCREGLDSIQSKKRLQENMLVSAALYSWGASCIMQELQLQ